MIKQICIVENDKPVGEGNKHVTLCGTDVEVEFRKGNDPIEICTACVSKHRIPNRPDVGRFSAQVVVMTAV